MGGNCRATAGRSATMHQTNLCAGVKLCWGGGADALLKSSSLGDFIDVQVPDDLLAVIPSDDHTNRIEAATIAGSEQ